MVRQLIKLITNKLKRSMKIDINGVSITLTKDQLDEIARQTRKFKTIEDIQSVEDALEILNKKKNYFDQFEYDNEQEEADSKLKIIIKAANFIDNDNKEYKADFTDTNTAKYAPYFERKSSGWSLHSVDDCDCSSGCPVGFYYKKRDTAEIMAKRFSTLYNKWLG